ncbi:hypothetical protein [Catellatospora sp. IY07-71]|uniref:hypothetical protein n=1 Tax=Catellatospora sp. IY07-71 TaxID=2728827 RepID=UPI001BB42135|nr:hypothetical protein [Catellatospora sp. IY07-71]
MPEQYREAFEQERAALLARVEEVRAALRAGDRGRLLGGLAAAGGLDEALVEEAFAKDRFLGNELFGDASRYGGPAQAPSPYAAMVRPYAQEVLWRLSAAALRDDELPQFRPHGLRFALRGLDWAGEAATGERFGAAALTPDELAAYVAHLDGQPEEVRQRAFRLRRAAGDAYACKEGHLLNAFRRGRCPS